VRFLLGSALAVALGFQHVPVAVAQEAGIAVGVKAPAVAVHDLDGKLVQLDRFIGSKPVFLEFWATWCELCEELIPEVKAARAAYGDKVEFIGINVSVNQSPNRVRSYIKTHQPAFNTLYDDEGTSIRAYQVPSTSYVVIVDRTGKVAYTGIGGTQKFDAALRQVTRQ
jgi:thiol-disulfide isomerase/thioredoxin